MKIVIPKTSEKNHNVSSESDSSLVIRYVGFFLCIIFTLYILFWSLSFVVIQFVSIEDEQKYFSFWDIDILWKERELPKELQERYADIPYNISIIDMDGEANAFASLGWQMYLTEAFLEEIDYYEELDFVVGHELAHVEHRDVLRNLVSSFPVIIILSIFWGDHGLTLFNGIIGNTHSKMHESRADIDAVEFLQKTSGHVWCALDFFEKSNTLEGNLMEVFSTHPVTELRIQRIQKYIEDQWYIKKSCTPYPW